MGQFLPYLQWFDSCLTNVPTGAQRSSSDRLSQMGRGSALGGREAFRPRSGVRDPWASDASTHARKVKQQRPFRPPILKSVLVKSAEIDGARGTLKRRFEIWPASAPSVGLRLLRLRQLPCDEIGPVEIGRCIQDIAIGDAAPLCNITTWGHGWLTSSRTTQPS